MDIKIEVDMHECQDHGQCVFASPELFRFGSSGRLEHEEYATVDEAGLATVQEAADICPLQVITIHQLEA